MSRKIARTSLAALLAAGLLAADAAPSDAPERPRRRPDGGGYFVVRGSVPLSSVALGGGDDSRFEGTLWFAPETGKNFHGATTLTVKSAAGARVELPAIEFTVDADLDAAGAAEAQDGALDEAVLRALSASDLALLPLSGLLCHHMPYEGSSKQASKETRVSDGSATVQWSETDLGQGRTGGVMTRRYFTRSVRRLLPSGFAIHDWVLTCRDPDENLVLYSTGLRLLAHPSRPLEGGVRPAGGVYLVVKFEATQLEWLTDEEMVENADRAALEEKFRTGLENALFQALKTEGIGDPFDSPAAIALRLSGLLDDKSLARLINGGDRKALTLVAPQIVSDRIPLDPAAHLELWKTTDDPAERLLLAAAAATGGASEPRFEEELALALNSRDQTVLRAAALLARALGDADAQKRAEDGLRTAGR
jgi:hypothetical protein